MLKASNYTAKQQYDTLEVCTKEQQQYTRFEFESVPPLMKQSISQGLIDESADFNGVGATCSTGNCTIGPYITLGVCSSTEDFSSHIRSYCPDDDFEPCTFTVDELQTHPPLRPGNTTLQFLWIGARGFQGAKQDIPQAWLRQFNETGKLWADGYDYENPGSLVEFYVLSDPLPTSSNMNLRSRVKALKGTLHLCFYRMKTTVTAGVTVTQKIDKIDGISWELSNKGYSGNWTIPKTPLPNDIAHEGFAISASKQAITNYLAREVFFGEWYRDKQVDVDASDMADSDAARAIGRATYSVEASGYTHFKDTERVGMILENVAARMTTA